jgi:hypothetical protein
MIGGSPIFMPNPGNPPFMGYDPRLAQQRPAQALPPAVPAQGQPIFRGVMGKERQAPPRRPSSAIPTPEQLGLAPAGKPCAIARIPTPEELGLARPVEKAR